MLIIDADDFYMKFKKMLIQWISNFEGQVQQTKLNVSSQSKGNELDCL